MPYIEKYDRKAAETDPVNAGELNYAFTCLILNYIARKGEAYSVFNEIVGALECCKLELVRRKLAPYEDKKIKENGDVY